METLEQAIRAEVSEIPAGMFFDSHVVIKMLLQKHCDCYLSQMPKKESVTTRTYHQKGMLQGQNGTIRLSPS